MKTNLHFYASLLACLIEQSTSRQGLQWLPAWPDKWEQVRASHQPEDFCGMTPRYGLDEEQV